jgi:ATP-dependent RNA helicase RhlE
MNFAQFELAKTLLDGVTREGYVTPTPIQEKAIPVVMKGHDLIGVAQTGTGKTAAFVLPILNRLLSLPRGQVRALIIAPTRELALQIEKCVISLGEHTAIKSTPVFGGVPMNPQISKLRAGVDVVVACPGRLLDHMQRKTIDLSKLEVLVLDEADQMFDMGFLPTIKKIVAALPKERQTLLFSATMPEDIKRLTMAILKQPKTVEVGRIAPAQTVAHAVYLVPQEKKTHALEKLLEATTFDSAIVFTRTKHRAKRLGMTLEKMGYSVTSLQGNLSQNRREEAMSGFRRGKYKIMVATDIAARGIDITTVSHVINYDVPETPETYTHRIGRTGRAERSGEAFTFVDREEAKKLNSIERFLGRAIQRREVDLSGFVAPAKESRPEQQQRGRSEGRGDSRGGGARGDRSGGNRSNSGRDRGSRDRDARDRGNSVRSEAPGRESRSSSFGSASERGDSARSESRGYGNRSPETNGSLHRRPETRDGSSERREFRSNHREVAVEAPRREEPRPQILPQAGGVFPRKGIRILGKKRESDTAEIVPIVLEKT